MAAKRPTVHWQPGGASYGRGVAASRSRRQRAARRRRRRMERVEHDLTAEQWTALQAAWSGCAYCSASDSRLQRECVLAISRWAATPSTTWCRRADRATPASATTRSPAGCADGDSTSGRSCCATLRSVPRSTRSSVLRHSWAWRRRRRVPETTEIHRVNASWIAGYPGDLERRCRPSCSRSRAARLRPGRPWRYRTPRPNDDRLSSPTAHIGTSAAVGLASRVGFPRSVEASCTGRRRGGVDEVRRRVG